MSVDNIVLNMTRGKVKVDSSPTHICNLNGLSYDEYLWNYDNPMNLEELSYLRAELFSNNKHEVWNYSSYWTPQIIGRREKDIIYVGKVCKDTLITNEEICLHSYFEIPKKLTSMRRGFIQGFEKLDHDLFFPILGNEQTQLGMFDLNDIEYIPLPVAVGLDGYRVEPVSPVDKLGVWEKKIE